VSLTLAQIDLALKSVKQEYVRVCEAVVNGESYATVRVSTDALHTAARRLDDLVFSLAEVEKHHFDDEAP